VHMRAVVQRVAAASVTVDNELVSRISRGFMILVGISRDDTPSDIEALAKKIFTLRAFPDPQTGAQWKASIKDISGDILCVSQFTLLANFKRGKPDFHHAMAAESSKAVYCEFLRRLGQLYMPEKIKDGQFGAMMDVTLTNEGPVTFTLESRRNGDDKTGGQSDKISSPVDRPLSNPFLAPNVPESEDHPNDAPA